MSIGGDNSTTQQRMTGENMEGDLDMTVRVDKLDEKGTPLIHSVKHFQLHLRNAEVYEEWEQDAEDEDVNCIDIYESGEEGGKGSEDSDEVHGEEEIDEEDDEDVECEQEDLKGEQRDKKWWEKGNDDVYMTDEGETSCSGLGSRMQDLGRPDSPSSSGGLYSQVAEHGFRTST